MGSILGNRVARVEDRRFLTVGGTYVEDVRVPGAPAWLTYVRSSHAHARITGVDVSEAKVAPGVLAVLTGDDLAELGLAPVWSRGFPEAMRRPFLARDVVRFVGEPVVALVAEDRARAADAADLVVVDYEPLPVVIDPDAALDDDVLLFPEAGSNVVSRFASASRADFTGCEVVVEERIVNQRLAAAPLEPRSAAAWWTDGGRLVHYASCQGAHPTRDVLAEVYGLEPSQVRVVVPDVGGGFGAKARPLPDEMALGFCARVVGRPVRWTETRSENMVAMAQGRGQVQHVRLGGTRDGRITAFQLDVVQDAGAYPALGARLPMMTMLMTTGAHDIANAGFSGVAVVTNTVSTTAYRGAGRPEAAVAIERMVDRYAAEIGLDPAEVRRRNLVARFTEPHTTAVGTVYDVGDYPAALERVLEAAGYDALREEQARRRAAGDPVALGIGLATYVEITAIGGGSELGVVEVLDGGRVRVTSGATPFGQGHDTTWAMIVADRLGVAVDDVEVVHGDTDRVARGGLTVASRSVQLAGTAIASACTKVVELGRQRAGDLLEAAVADVVLDAGTGRFHVVGTPARSLGWSDLIAGDRPVSVAAGASAAAGAAGGAGVADAAGAGAGAAAGAAGAAARADAAGAGAGAGVGVAGAAGADAHAAGRAAAVGGAGDSGAGHGAAAGGDGAADATAAGAGVAAGADAVGAAGAGVVGGGAAVEGSGGVAAGAGHGAAARADGGVGHGDGGGGGAGEGGGGGPLVAETDHLAEMPTFPFGAHVAVVEVDTETGGVRLRQLVALDDAGRILNPLLAEGQVHGGIAQGVAQALLEAVRYDDAGQPLTTNFADYLVISASELPSFDLVPMATPTFVNELGAKGIGESGTIGSIPAVYNAVVDALGHLGVRHLETPLSPERIWAALAAVRR